MCLTLHQPTLSFLELPGYDRKVLVIISAFHIILGIEMWLYKSGHEFSDAHT